MNFFNWLREKKKEKEKKKDLPSKEFISNWLHAGTRE